MSADDLAAAACALAGTTFRLHGRTEATGLDCVGVLAAALARLGRPAPLPTGYPLRHRNTPDLSALVKSLGLMPVDGAISRGDVLMLRPAPCQLHLAIAAAPDTMVHAHAGLGKVVIGPLPAGWPLIGHWRFSIQ